jgi:hypothetical protein
LFQIGFYQSFCGLPNGPVSVRTDKKRLCLPCFAGAVRRAVAARRRLRQGAISQAKVFIDVFSGMTIAA